MANITRYVLPFKAQRNALVKWAASFSLFGLGSTHKSLSVMAALLPHSQLHEHNYRWFTTGISATAHRLSWRSAAPRLDWGVSEETKNNIAEIFNTLRANLPRSPRRDEPDSQDWKDEEEKIIKDIEPTVMLTKDILHSQRYKDGEQLTDEDEKAVVENLLAYHPHAEDKIGCGLDSIMVDRNPKFGGSRCLFVVRTDGCRTDFSYRKCLRKYLEEKYPTHAERFIEKHFKHWTG